MPALHIEGLRFLDLGPWSFDLPAAELTGLSGPSGAGKSRLMRALADLDPHSGQILLDDVEQSSLPAPVWRRRVGLLPAEPRYWLSTGLDHLRTDGSPGPDADDALLGALGLELGLLEQPVKRLSSGERQRLGLLRLLRLQPDVLLLDEPTANLDRESATAVEGVVGDYASQHQAAVLWVGHDPEQMQRLCTRRYQIADGALERQG